MFHCSLFQVSPCSTKIIALHREDGVQGANRGRAVCPRSRGLLRNLEARWDYSIYVQWQLFFQGKYSDLYFCVYFLTGLSAWAFAASSMVIGIYGGWPVEIWGTLAIGAALSEFCLNLAEYGSAFPNAGCCTYIATQLGGPKYGRIAVRIFAVRRGVLRLTEIGLLNWCLPFFHCCLYSSSVNPCSFWEDFHLRLLFSSGFYPEKVANVDTISDVQYYVSRASEVWKCYYWGTEWNWQFVYSGYPHLTNS
jgi:hypothetical protein